MYVLNVYVAFKKKYIISTQRILIDLSLGTYGTVFNKNNATNNIDIVEKDPANGAAAIYIYVTQKMFTQKWALLKLKWKMSMCCRFNKLWLYGMKKSRQSFT